MNDVYVSFPQKEQRTVVIKTLLQSYKNEKNKFFHKKGSLQKEKRSNFKLL